MAKSKSNFFLNQTDVVLFLLLLGFFTVISMYNYLLFHTLAEIFSIVIAFAIFIIAWNSRKFIDNHYLMFIGIAYLFIAILDLLHTLAYKGMNIFESGANISTQLWISARYMEAISLAVAPLFITRKLKYYIGFTIYLAATMLIILSIFYWDIFPLCYTGTELTVFKKVSEYIVIAILLSSIFFLYNFRNEFDRSVLILLVSSILVTAIAEIFFTLYKDVYGLFNLFGHFFKIISFYLIYKALIETGLRKPYQTLFRRLKKSRDLLEDRSHKLELINKDLESFAYTVSHDLRSPLRGIDGYSYSLQEEYGKKLDNRGQEFIKNIRSLVKRMSQLIDDILKISHISTRNLTYSEFNMGEMAKQVFSELKSHYQKKSVEFISDPQMVVKADKDLISILLTNLIENSLKFINNNNEGKIEFKKTVADDKLIYYIKDNGMGMDMKYAKKIFKPFEKGHSNENIKGSGVGLATAKKIVNMHKGKIWIESEINKGTTIYFTLGA
ncbi:MAG: MASE3 domain-containing protein [Actinomycetota bacterium]